MKKKMLTDVVRYLLLAAVALAGCLPDGASSSSSPSTYLSPTNVSSPTTIGIGTISPEMPQGCVTGEPDVAGAQFGIPGILIYEAPEGVFAVGGSPARTRQLASWDRKKVLPKLIGFSPNGEWVAYFTYSPSANFPYSMHLLSASGNVTTVTPDPSEILPLYPNTVAWTEGRWINDKTILLSLYDPEFYKEYKRDRPVLLDPFTGAWDTAMLKRLPERDPGSDVSISPGQDRVLYFSMVTTPKWKRQLVLWDVKKQQTLWQDDGIVMGSRFLLGGVLTSAWSPTDARLAFVGPEVAEQTYGYDHDGVYILDGETKQLQLVTNFLLRYEAFTTKGLAWSPDGRYLAFVVEYYRKDLLGKVADDIYLYDSLTEKPIKFCPMMGDVINTTTGTLVWSPDSRYIAYVPDYSSGSDFGKPRPLIVINIYTGEATILAEDVGTVGGWSEAFP